MGQGQPRERPAHVGTFGRLAGKPERATDQQGGRRRGPPLEPLGEPLAGQHLSADVEGDHETPRFHALEQRARFALPDMVVGVAPTGFDFTHPAAVVGDAKALDALRIPIVKPDALSIARLSDGQQSQFHERRGLARYGPASRSGGWLGEGVTSAASPHRRSRR